jgi:hypothetical protein
MGDEKIQKNQTPCKCPQNVYNIIYLVLEQPRYCGMQLITFRPFSIPTIKQEKTYFIFFPFVNERCIKWHNKT